MSTWLVGLEVLLPLTVVLACRLRGKPIRADLVLACPALVAPLALLYPWAAVPDHLGVGLAEPRFFVQWLTKYPTFGPINHKVLLGIICILGASLVPPALAGYRLAGGRRRGFEILLASAAVLVYVPVLVRLDVHLWIVGLLGAPSLLGTVHPWQAACGPLVRGLACLAAVAIATRAALARGARTTSS